MIDRFVRILKRVPYYRLRRNIFEQMIFMLIACIVLLGIIYFSIKSISKIEIPQGEYASLLIFGTLGTILLFYAIVDFIIKHAIIFYLLPIVALLIIYIILIIELILLKKAFIKTYGKDNYNKAFIKKQYETYYINDNKKETNN